MSPSGFTQYQGRDPGLKLTFHYPAGWRLQEEQGTIDRYRQVRLLGPRNSEDTYTPYFSVAGAPLRADGGRFEDLAERVVTYKAHVPADAKIEKETARLVGGEKAFDITVAYTVPPLHRPGLKAIPIPVKTRTLFLQKGRYLYEIIHSADAREYGLQERAFGQLLKTLRFQES
ncbi:MAG: hypothetical protein HY211_05200 [Candidatus Omnitrophica bacterium]|nr:hypothetical protein [Candidatus Omnitrophota bacterium]